MTSVTTEQEAFREVSTGDLLRSLMADLGLMLRREAELAKLEVNAKASRLETAGGLIAGAGVVALFGLGTLIAAAVLALAIVLPAWAAAVIVGAMLVIVALTLFMLGRARMRSVGKLLPTETLELVREDLAWMGREAEQIRSG
jgi:hypothetical protein